MATTINVTGMSCDGCEDIVEGALEEVSGVESADADQDENTVVIEGDADVDDLVEAVDIAGYESSGTVEGGASEESESEEVESEEAEEAEEAESEEAESEEAEDDEETEA